MQPVSVIKTNVLEPLNVVQRLPIGHEGEQVVALSTDKAAAPI